MASPQVFISYADQDKDHALRLRDRLKQEGLDVWFEDKSLLAGQNQETVIRKAIKESRLFVALLSSRSVRRGKANKQLELALDTIGEFPENDIYIVPVKLDECEPSQFKLEKYKTVNMFPDWDDGFQKILQTIRLIFPECQSETLARADDPTFVKNLFDLYDSKQAIMLLAQDGRTDMTGTLKAEAENRFDAANVRHMVPPPGPALRLEDYFSAMARQFQKQANSAVSFMTVIEDLLADGNNLFLLITRFEQGNETGNSELAGALRSLLERFRHLNILICGGEKLADQFFGGALSLLNNSEVRELPEPGLADIQCRCPDQKPAEKILEISGGHPRLIEECLNFFRKTGGFKDPDCREHLMNALSVMKMFTPFRESPDRQRICRLLENNEVGNYKVPDIFDPVIKMLYWKNLLRKSKDGKKLVWRSEILRKMGQTVLSDVGRRT